MGFCRGTLLRCITPSKKRRNRSRAFSHTVLLFPIQKPTQPSQHSASLVPSFLSGPLASTDEWQLQLSRASSCSPCTEACSITQTSRRWCVIPPIQTIFPRIFLHPSAISRNSYDRGRRTAIPDWYVEISLTGLNQKTSVFLLSVRKQNVFLFFFLPRVNLRKEIYEGCRNGRCYKTLVSPAFSNYLGRLHRYTLASTLYSEELPHHRAY